MDIKQLKENVRDPYAWPGGYEIVSICNDGEVLCYKCVRFNFREVLWSTKNKVNDGWNIVDYAVIGNTIESTDKEPIFCAHCNKQF